MASKILKAKLWDDTDKDPPGKVSSRVLGRRCALTLTTNTLVVEESCPRYPGRGSLWYAQAHTVGSVPQVDVVVQSPNSPY